MSTTKNEAQPCYAAGLLCEGRATPLGIDARQPQFSWHFMQAGRDRGQTAYRLLVADSRPELDRDRGNLWDSGQRDSAATHLIRYEGLPLASRTRYFWKVRVWEASGVPGAYSEPAEFETGLLKQAEWQAAWIGGYPLLRTTFALDKRVVRARVYVTAAGYYELRINGRKVGDEVLSPSFTSFEQRNEYQVFAVEAYLRDGANAVGLMLGQGWYKAEPRALLQLELRFADGSALTVVSDHTWRGNDGPIRAASIYDGERYDARAERAGWDQGRYDDGDWHNVRVFDAPSAKLVARSLPPIHVVERIRPLAISRPYPGIAVVDFGQNFAGWTRLQLQGEEGRTVALKYAELLNEDGTVNQRNLRKAKATDEYICQGEGLESYEPRFTYHGFRYVQIENYPGLLTEERIIGQVVHSSVRETSGFACSNPLFNRIHQAMKWTLRNNLHSVPTDCCQRDERQGWLGDGHIASEAAIHNFDMHQFYKKWLEDIRDVQDPLTGTLLGSTAPLWFKSQSVPWMAAYFIVLWNLYRYYGDKSALEDHYDNLRRLFAYFHEHTDGHLLTIEEPHGDWLAIQHTPYNQITNGFYCMVCRIMAEISQVLGEQAQAEKYRTIAAEIRQAYNDRFYTPQTGFYGQLQHISQFGNALPLWLEMAPAEERAKVVDSLLWDIEHAHGSVQLTTGILGTKYTVELLSRLGRNDLVYQLFNRTAYPGWGFMIDHGATTIWERWQYLIGSEMNSHNHPALTSADTWFLQELLGMKLEWADGVGKFVIQPYFAPGLSSAKGYWVTPWGRFGVAWTRKPAADGTGAGADANAGVDADADIIAVDLHLPANVETAVLFAVPGKRRIEVTEAAGGRRIDASGPARLAVGSGEYSFMLVGSA